MPASPFTSRRLVPLLAACAVAGAAVPAGASAAIKVRATPDKAAPAGKTPKVQFTLRGATKGKRYRVTAEQVSGEKSVSSGGAFICTSLQGRLDFERAPGRKFALAPSYQSYEIGSTRPCNGIYKGSVEQDR